MTIREELEKAETEYLSKYAVLSINSRGREREEEPCDIRPVFQRDRDRIIHSKAFRRLKDKTQVFLNPEGDHYRTRLTHTLEVSQIARTIAKALKLNEELCEAIALGHDLGHTPFGHAGERAINAAMKDYFDGKPPFVFKHSEQGVRVASILERDGEGLNLTWEVRDGIANHQTSSTPSTLEGKVVRLADKFAYIHHDMDDAIRARVLSDSDVPKEIGEVLGFTTKDRLDCLIHNTIRSSMGKNDICMEPEVMQAMLAMRKFMFGAVYSNPIVKGEEHKAETLVETLFKHYCDHPDELPEEYNKLMERGDSPARVACDYIASMTDRYAIVKYEELFIPISWKY
ncbi:MAG: deoxyguanosinetriphosphate triphosphohydrolase [Lachnospiraceae bacterium]|nr:deoxyguanosinetriphosphate triphosphohydrolase [Lachnospiraceae bacterium]